MTNREYKRVSRKRLCRICEKPDWCSYTFDEKISFCARVNAGAARTSRNGWGVFYHEKTAFQAFALPFPSESKFKKPELAPLEIRNFAYQKLIELSPATKCNEIIDGPKGLRARKILTFDRFGSLPQTAAERNYLAKAVRSLINQVFPDYVRKQQSGIAGLPGFWLDENGAVRLASDKDYKAPLMLIPYRSRNNLIQACQIRFMCQKIEKGLRYVWLSTPHKANGASSGSPLHFAGCATDKTFNQPILIVEGALKAETVKFLKPDNQVIANGGVTASHHEIIHAARNRALLIGFDRDDLNNQHVARAFARLILARYSDAAKRGYKTRVKILSWNSAVKGIDEALLQRLEIQERTPSEWFESLSAFCQNEIRATAAASQTRFC